MTTALAPFVPVQDADPAWVDLEGTVRVRVAAGIVQLQISTDNGDGTFDIATVILNGGLRDVRKNSTTKWPSYTADGLPTNFVTDAQRLAAEELAAKTGPRSRVTSPGVIEPPVSGSNTDAGH